MANMATAKNHPPDPPPEGIPGPSYVNHNDRTVPEWMDRLGMHGQRIILSLRPAGNTPLPNPWIIGKSIENASGRSKLESAETEDKGTKYILKTRNAEQAKKLMQMTELIDGTKVEIILHPFLNSCRCVVSCREVIDMTESELLNELTPQGISGVRRISRMDGNQKINTPTLILTVCGTVAPKRIFFGPLSAPTRLFYPRPMICFNCCEFGHTRVKCQKMPACTNCSGNAHVEGQQCNQVPYCKNCQGDHAPVSRKCPWYAKEEKIIKIKVEAGVSFGEARKEYEKLHGKESYAAVSGAQARIEKIQKDNERDNEIRTLKDEIVKLREANNKISNDEKDREIASLRKEIEGLRKVIEGMSQNRVVLGKQRFNLDISETEELASETEPQNTEPEAMEDEDIYELRGSKEQNGRKRGKNVESESDNSKSSDKFEEKQGNQSKSNNTKRGRPPKHRKNDQRK